MALSFTKKEAVQFGDFASMPQKLKATDRLRFKSLNFQKDSEEQIAKTLATAFPEEDRAKIEQFIVDNLSTRGAMKLRDYILGGEAEVEDSLRNYDRMMDKIFEESGVIKEATAQIAKAREDND